MLKIIEYYVNFLGFIVGVLCLYFTLWIYRKQKGESRFHEEQIDTLKAIASETHAITSSMESDGYRRKFVNAFFFPGAAPGSSSRMICLFPAMIRGQRLPTISAGDYHALHVLQSLLGADNMDLSFQSGVEDGQEDGAGRDAIYLGGPQNNRALKRFAPAVDAPRSGHPETLPTLDGLPLHCWFANEERGQAAEGEKKIQKKIWIRGRSDCLPSQAEHFYDEDCPEQPCPKEQRRKSALATDYALILRQTGARRVFVLAGIHQFGTWIAGEFLRRLSTEKDRSISPHERAAFLEPGDVMAIVWGEFDRDALVVRKLGIHQKCLWVRSGEEWKEWDEVHERNRKDSEDEVS